MNMFWDALRRGWQNPWFSGQMLIWTLILILSFGLALLLRYTSLESSTVPAITYFINAVALISGGYISGKRAGERGWYFGGMQGVIYSLLLALLSFLAFDLQMNTNLFLFLISAFGMGALGGIFGVNAEQD